MKKQPQFFKKPIKPLTRWEYFYLEKKLFSPGFEFTDLQSMGNQGWECCGFLGAFWMFKRQLRPNATPQYYQCLRTIDLQETTARG